MSSSTKNFLTPGESEGEWLISQKALQKYLGPTVKKEGDTKMIASRITKKLCRCGKVHTYFKC